MMSTSTILIIEDEKLLARNIGRYLERFNFNVEITENGNEALNQLVISPPDLVLLDLKLPDMNGLEILSRIRKFEPSMKVIMMTAFGDVETAVTAMKEGASDFLTKPLKLTKLKELLDRILQQPPKPEDMSALSESPRIIKGLIGEDDSMLRVKQQISQLLDSESRVTLDPPTVLITGSTGTGKELVARALHYQGLRASSPFLNLGGAIITPELLDRSHLILESNENQVSTQNTLASIHGGTLFLDEIANASLEVQAKLVDLVSERDPSNLDGSPDRKTNIRIIASTSQPLEDLVQSGQFRADLYFRLHVINIALPPLCQRNQDILVLAQHFLSLFAQRYGKTPLKFDSGAKANLMSHVWPGNVRELRNLIEQTVLSVNGNIVDAGILNLPVSKNSEQDENLRDDSVQLRNTTERTERENLVAALDHAAWNVSLAARILSVSRDTLRYRIKKYRLKRPKIW